MFAVRRYTNQQGENMFVPTFGTEPSQPIPAGFSLADETEGPAQKILKKEGLSVTGEASADVLTRAGLMAPKKTIFEQDKTEDVTKVADTTKVEDTTQVADTTQTQDTTVAEDTTKQDAAQTQIYGAERLTSTEKPDVVTAQTINHLTTQLRNQYNAIQKGSGYKYKNEKELDQIFSAQAAKLAVNGINDLRDVGVEEVEQIETKRVYKKGDKYYYTQLADSEGEQDQEVAIDPAKIKDVREKEETIDGDSGPFAQKRIEVDVLATTNKFLINKVTGKRLDYIKFTSPQFRKDLATKGEFSTSLAGSKGTLPLQDRGGFNRWGHQLDVDGQADYAAEFVDGNFITMPVWKDTKTDLTPYMMMASIALTAGGAAGAIGGTLTPTGTSVAAQNAVGNAVIAGGFTAATGGDFEDIAKAAVLSGGMTYVSAQLPAVSKKIGESVLGKGAPGAMTVGAAVTNAGVNGIAAALMGQDVEKAMLSGAVQGAVQVNASDFLKSAFGEDMFKKLSSATNLSDKEMESLVVRSISRSAGAMAYNQNFFKGFRDSLLREGLSLSAANAATKSLSTRLDEKQLKKVHNVVRKTTSLAVIAKQRGLNVADVLESAYPKIILSAAISK